MEIQVRIRYLDGELAETHIAHWHSIPRRPIVELSVQHPDSHWEALPPYAMYAVMKPPLGWFAHDPVHVYLLNWHDHRLQGEKWSIFEAALASPVQKEPIDVDEKALAYGQVPAISWFLWCVAR
jgi:hypothetical protein